MTKLERYTRMKAADGEDKVFVLSPQENLRNMHIDGNDIYFGSASSIMTYDSPQFDASFFGDVEIVKYRDWNRDCWLTRYLPLCLKDPEYRISTHARIVHEGQMCSGTLGYEEALRRNALEADIRLPNQKIIRELFGPIEQRALELIKEYEDIRFQEDPRYRARMEEKRYLEQRRKLRYSTARNLEDGLRTAADHCFLAAARPGVKLEDELGLLVDYLMKGCGSEDPGREKE